MTLNDYWRVVNMMKRANPEWRLGQTACNMLSEFEPDLRNKIINTLIDPFYIEDKDIHNSEVWMGFINYLNDVWEE